MADDVLALINHSPDVSDSDGQAIAAALTFQIQQHIAPIWLVHPVTVNYIGQSDPPGTDPIMVILSNPDSAGALGYHDEAPNGQQFSRIFTDPIFEAAKSKAVLTGDISVATTCSHEGAEWIGDRRASEWIAGPNFYAALELADPVEDVSYSVTVNGVQVSVSDFVLPNWFDVNVQPDVATSYAQSVNGPFTVRPQGYVIVDGGNGPQSVWGTDYPTWRKALKQQGPSRTNRRTHIGERHEAATAERIPAGIRLL